MQRATTQLAADVGPALAGSSAAAYRLTPAFNTLSNCRNPLDIGLAQTPPELARARKQTIRACRLIYVGTDGVISGLNTLQQRDRRRRASRGYGRASPCSAGSGTR